MPRSAAAFITASARGCSLPRSRAAVSRRTCSPVNPSPAVSFVNRGFPSVRVPVLSKTRVSTVRRRSMASAFRKRIPARAPRPMATVTVMGVARPRAHGQAMMRTATAFRRA